MSLDMDRKQTRSSAKQQQPDKRRRRTATLRKHQHVENVIVEETFNLLSSESKDGSAKVGDGIFVSATTANNKRYYGVMVDQPSLKVANAMWLQDQASSLELNRRMKVLKQQQQQQEESNQKPIARVPNDSIDKEVSDRNTREQMEISTGPSAPTITLPATEMGKSDHANSSNDDAETLGTGKRSLDTTDHPERGNKRSRISDGKDSTVDSARLDPVSTANGGNMEVQLLKTSDRPVQKLKYIVEKATRSNRGATTDDPGYRVLVATFSNVVEAACGDMHLARKIEKACEEGGNYLPGDTNYYYQYEVLPSALISDGAKESDYDLRTSMGFHSFLLNTSLPPWFPLSNMPVSQAKVLEMLNMKKDNSGKVIWEESRADRAVSGENVAASLAGGTTVSMQARSQKRYQIGVIGGGIAGVACCHELVSQLKSAGIDFHITLFEARSRLGGRIWTEQSFKDGNNEVFPIELGASWIHGIDDNPLAALAKEAGIDFMTASEEVQMLGQNMKRVDAKLDERAGKLFDDLLDHAADDCWSAPEFNELSADNDKNDGQSVVRWYASVFADKSTDIYSKNKPNLPRVKTPKHRWSSDSPIDVEMGKAILKYKLKEFSNLSPEEHQMLLWNTKNVEYALGANIPDLSMKYWDADDRHAFDGDHVMLKQGYSSVIDFMIHGVKAAAGDNFEVLLNFPVGKVEYARKSATLSYPRSAKSEKLLDLSDTCSVSSQDGSTTKYFDFAVCACPLGVLKESVQNSDESTEKLSFLPPLPFSKVDAITSIGFGLLNKVYLTFPKAFWRQDGIFKANDQCLFGNVSGVHPHYYMFFDIGRCLVAGEDAPAILMSLVSGREAVACEFLSDQEIKEEVMTTLRTLFPPESVPEPTSFRFTRWGQDKYSRGAYTFLPPGATDQDFQVLQSPINGNGDSLLLEGSETMRLFFAGEHTTALHPSMAHGAMLSGMRAAKEVLSSIHFKLDKDKDFDRVIPVALFRHNNPDSDLRCNLCNKVGGQIREGSLIAFKRGARQVLLHNNCAEFSPEVEVIDSKWKNVIKAVNRGKSLHCSFCKEVGATIGCTALNCYRVFHYSCSEDAGWRFERDGKTFYCDLHRNLAQDYSPHCDRISMKYYVTKYPAASRICRLCLTGDDATNLGELLAFQKGPQHACIHESCIKYTSICDTAEDEDSRMGHDYKNVFQAINEARECKSCKGPGATVRCSIADCDEVFHVPCARKGGWNFERRGKSFRCEHHRKKHHSNSDKTDAVLTSNGESAAQSSSSLGIGGIFNHNLLAQFGGVLANPTKVSAPGNLDMGGAASMAKATQSAESEESDYFTDSEESIVEVDQAEVDKAMDLPLSTHSDGVKQSLLMKRPSVSDPWGLWFSVATWNDKHLLVLVSKEDERPDTNITSDSSSYNVIVSINGETVGSEKLRTLRQIVSSVLKEKTELVLETVPTGVQ